MPASSWRPSQKMIAKGDMDGHLRASQRCLGDPAAAALAQDLLEFAACVRQWIGQGRRGWLARRSLRSCISACGARSTSTRSSRGRVSWAQSSAPPRRLGPGCRLGLPRDHDITLFRDGNGSSRSKQQDRGPNFSFGKSII